MSECSSTLQKKKKKKYICTTPALTPLLCAPLELN